MTGAVDTLAAEALMTLRAEADTQRATVMRRYAPTSEEHLGATVPQARAAASRIARALKSQKGEVVVDAAESLLALGAFDTRCTAAYLLGRRPDVVRALTSRDVERLAAGNDNWAAVDAFTAEVAGPAWRDGQVADVDVRRWAASEDVWTRRMALVATTALNRRGGSEPKQTLDICERLVDDGHPLIRKALSWALRALVPTAPEAVWAFVSAHPELPRSVTREVETKLRTGRKSPPPQR